MIFYAYKKVQCKIDACILFCLLGDMLQSVFFCSKTDKPGQSLWHSDEVGKVSNNTVAHTQALEIVTAEPSNVLFTSQISENSLRYCPR